MLGYGNPAVAPVFFTLPLSAYDKRLIDGVGIWAKPMKFQLSLVLQVVTLAMVASTMSNQWREARLTSGVSVACNIAIVFEIASITLQASRGEASQFNLSTPLYAAVYKLMVVGAIVLTCSAGVVGIIASFDHASSTNTALRTAILLGLVGGKVLTLVVAMTRGARMSHIVVIEPAGNAGMQLTGWSLKVGDLRVPHFFATNMMQAVPSSGMAISRAFTTGPSDSWLYAYLRQCGVLLHYGSLSEL